jgi:cytochrome c oxidase cbb3-type subunit III
MRERLALASILFGALCSSGCHTAATEAASLGGTPAVGIAVGPVPGAGSAPALPVDPYTGNNVALAQGRELFIQYNCYGCHGGHGGGGMGPSLRNHNNYQFGSDDAHVFASIAEGRAHGMPSWGIKLPQDQIWRLTAYIQSMGTRSEPQPPPPFPGPTASDQSVLQR